MSDFDSAQTAIVTLGEELDQLAHDQAVWSRATFGADKDRGPVGALKHLEKEAKEAWESAQILAGFRNVGPAIQGRTDRAEAAFREELADCLLLLLDASRRAGLTPLDLIRAAAAKMVKNKTRTWAEPTSDEPVEHVRGPGEGG